MMDRLHDWMPQRGKVKLLKFFDEPPTRPCHKYHRSRQTTPPPTLHIPPAWVGCFGSVHILLIEGFIVHRYIHSHEYVWLWCLSTDSTRSTVWQGRRIKTVIVQGWGWLILLITIIVIQFMLIGVRLRYDNIIIRRSLQCTLCSLYNRPKGCSADD